jgi:hypothetical protein
MSWQTFETASPGLAELCFDELDRKIAYLATIKKDGSPRLHPVTPFIGGSMLFIFTDPSSPKIGDLQRDGRYALHCAVSRIGPDGAGRPLVEVQVSGAAVTITDPGIRARAERIAGSPVVLASYFLFEFQVERVLVVEYEAGGKPIIRRWRKRDDHHA